MTSGSASDQTERTIVEGPASEPAARDADDVGPEIGRYLVIDEIGAGGMGRVFRAYDPKLGREVALKRLRLRAHGGETDGARMLREAKALAMLSHPNVVSIYDVDIDHGTVYIAMEYVRGATLKTWVVRSGHGWREVLAMFVQAGRGLAAAHAEGIVHRDFKPSNVVVGEDGRPRVMDFGLARAFGSTSESGAFESMPPALASPLDGDAADSHSGDLGATLTALGTVVGTPPYMAPEQHMGEAVDARTDQYAFCVALWEALYRKPAFAGRSASELAARKLAGPPKPSTTSGVPAQLHVLLARGLAPDPSARWPDMPTLLAALERAATPRRWRWSLFAGAATLVVAGGAWWIGRAPACSTSAEELADTWGPEQRASVEQALRECHAAFAESTVARVTASLDATAEAWIAMHRDACEATKVRHEQSDEALDLRMICLRARAHELAGVVTLLSSGGSEVTEHAVEVAMGLAPIERCADVAALRERVPPPEQAGVRETVEDIRARLADAKNVARAGKLADGLAMIEATQADAAATEYVPIQIEVELARADVLVLLDRDAEARPLLEHALDTGLAQHDEHAAGVAAVELAGLLMRSGQRADELQWLARIGLGLAEGYGQDPQLLADAMIMHGEVLADRELEREAEPYYAAAVALMERERGPNHPSLVSPLLADAEIVRALGRHEESKQIIERALAIVEDAYGPDHPQVGRALIARGWAALGDRRFVDAEADFARAEQIAEASFGPAHHATWSAMAMRAAALAERQRYDESIAMIESALARMNKPEERAHPTRASMLHNLGRVYSKKGDHERSAEIYREVVALRREYGHQGMLAAGLGSLGRELEALERWDEAERVL
ncbi:MAG TPA: serine/threonine-protein kinase, partial [Nannocystaceae bacterium]|nr:serine/threonine-protein kinase [Nannocystaceae bacterium]